MKSKIAAFMVGAALCATPAFAQTVANTSQKGSLLVFPLIDVRGDTSTIIQIANDNNVKVPIKCYYMNERKGRRDFEFVLTKKQPVWFDAKTGLGSDDLEAAVFPTDAARGGIYPGDVNVGELICWAVDGPGHNQISWNHLIGSATVVDSDEVNAYEYSAWSFKVQGSLAAGAVVGTPGKLELTGLPGGYDACPGYLVETFDPAGASLTAGANTIYYQDNDLSVVSCNQDLRQDFTPHYTKLLMPVWNEHEIKFTGAYECANSYHIFGLDPSEASEVPPGDITDVGAEIFTFATLKTDKALLKVQGVASTECPASEVSGLVAVLTTSVGVDAPSTENNELVKPLHAAGFTKGGYILWDPQDAIVPERR